MIIMSFILFLIIHSLKRCFVSTRQVIALIPIYHMILKQRVYFSVL